MYIITALSIAMLVFVLAVIIVGCTINDSDVIMTGIMLLLLTLLAHAAFQVGASWQHNDTLENYLLTPRTNESLLTTP